MNITPTANLSNAELLTVFLRSGGLSDARALSLAQTLLALYGGIRGVLTAPDKELLKIKDMGPARVAALKTIAALTVRYMDEELSRGPFIGHSRHVEQLLSAKFRDLQREVFAVVFLDTRHRVLSIETLFEGTINAATVYPREIIRRALEVSAAAIIAVHNHPSGNPDPSSDDKVVTRELTQACKTLDISLLDHIVIGGNQTFSFAQNMML